MQTQETLICVGGEVKALGEGRVGGYLVRFSDQKEKDLSGEFFTAKTYFGPRDGDGADLFFHHGQRIKGMSPDLADHQFSPVKTRRDDVGIFVEAALDMRDEYEQAVYELAAAGKLGWSSGTAGHLIKRASNGEIKRWPIVEASLTPTPAEPRNGASAIKTLAELIEAGQSSAITALESADTERDYEKALRDAGLSRKTAELALVRAKAIFRGEPEELAAVKGELEQAKALISRLDAQLLLARHQFPKTL